jgi:predicted site-specific integrase-resolvase
MPLLNVSEAAKATGKSRATLHRYIKDGRLSTVQDNDGQKKIDTSELLRVFGELLSNDTDSCDNKIQQFTDTTVAALHSQINMLRDELNAAHDRETKLLAMLEQHTLALAAPTSATAKKPGWFAWLFK